MTVGEEMAAFYPEGPHIAPEDLMQYTLEQLSPAETQAIEKHLASCAACREELAEVRADLGRYALVSMESGSERGTAMVDAPAGGRERLMAAILREREASAAGSIGSDTILVGSPVERGGGSFRDEPRPDEMGRGLTGTAAAGPVAGRAAAPASAAASEPASSPAAGLAAGPVLVPTRQSRLPTWIGWAVAAGLFFVAGHFHRASLNIERDLDKELQAKDAQIASLAGKSEQAREVLSALTAPEAQRVTLSLTKAPQPAQPTGRATYLPSRGTLIFVASHLAPLPAGKTYELWLIPADGTAPRAAGTFRPDQSGNANVVAPPMRENLTAKAFGVTIEPEGGSSTPTMPILLAGS
jgi:hypothetical protein